MGNTRIDVIALKNESIYSIAEISVSHKKDVYVITKHKKIPSKISIHSNGKKYLENKVVGKKLINPDTLINFSEITRVLTLDFSLDNLNRIYRRFSEKKTDCYFFINMNMYPTSAFFLSFYTLSFKGISKLVKQIHEPSTEQFFIYPFSDPMIGIIAWSFHPQRRQTPDYLILRE